MGGGRLVFLSCPRNCKNVKTLHSDIAAIFSSCVLHLWESGAAIPHRAICEGDSTRSRPFKNRTDHAFIRFPSQSSRKLRKLCQRQVSFPTSGLGLWPGWGSSVEESWSNTRPDRCIALERQKNTDAPRGFGGIRKSLSSSPFLSSRKQAWLLHNDIRSDDCWWSKHSISRPSCVDAFSCFLIILGQIVMTVSTPVVNAMIAPLLVFSFLCYMFQKRRFTFTWNTIFICICTRNNCSLVIIMLISSMAIDARRSERNWSKRDYKLQNHCCPELTLASVFCDTHGRNCD